MYWYNIALGGKTNAIAQVQFFALRLLVLPYYYKIRRYLANKAVVSCKACHQVDREGLYRSRIIVVRSIDDALVLFAWQHN